MGPGSTNWDNAEGYRLPQWGQKDWKRVKERKCDGKRGLKQPVEATKQKRLYKYCQYTFEVTVHTRCLEFNCYLFYFKYPGQKWKTLPSWTFVKIQWTKITQTKANLRRRGTVNSITWIIKWKVITENYPSKKHVLRNSGLSFHVHCPQPISECQFPTTALST